MKREIAIAAMLAAGLISGCADDGEEGNVNPCGHGTLINGKCICDAGYQQSQVDGQCDQQIGGETDPQPEEKCYITFYFTDASAAGKTVYLVGDFSDWKDNEKYKNYKMTELGDGTFALKAEVDQNDSIEFKYYIDGLGDAGWKTTEADGTSNIKIQFTSCGQSIGNSNGKMYSGDATAQIHTGGSTPVVDGDECETTFVYNNKYTDHDNDGNVTTFPVYLVGSFNTEADGTWKITDPTYKMTSDGNGNQSITIKLKKNSCYEYKFYIDGWGNDSWKTDASDGNANGFANISSCGLTFGNGKTDSSCQSSGGGSSSGGTSTTTTSNCWIKSVPTVQNKNISFEIECKDGTTEITSIEGGVNPQKSGMSVTDTVTENNKYSYIVKAGNNEVYVPVWVEDKQFNWHDAFLYFAFTDRFKDGNPDNNTPTTDATISGTSNAQWMGGDFKGMQTVVESGYFDNLGVNTLWISSVSMNAQGTSQGTNGDEAHWYSAYHSYWPVSSFMTDANATEFTSMESNGVKIQATEPHFGSMEDLKNLVDACHKRGIRVLIDFAANQVHKDSPVFKNHRDWFNDVDSPWLCDSNDGWNQYSEKCWFSQDLPDINYENASARQAMIDHVEWLIKKTNIDGFRVDAVKHMAIQFLKDMRAKTDQLYYNSGNMFYMVGETFDGDIGKLNNYIGDDLLHAQFDFNLYFAIRDNVLNGGNLGNVKNAFDAAKGYKSDLMGTFMGNHDVARALSIAAGQNQNKWGQNEELTNWEPYFKVKMAWTILLTNPGVPLVYYGDEYGQEGSNDPDNRRMMKFDNLNDQQKMQLGFVQQLGQIRRDHSALRYGSRNDLSVSDKTWCYTLSDGSETLLVALGLENNAKCSLNGNYTLKNLLNSSEAEFQTGEITFNDTNKLSVFLVK